MKGEFSKFIHLGRSGTPEARKSIAEAIFAHLSSGGKRSLHLDAGHHTQGIEQTLSDNTLLELCVKDRSLAERVTEEILENINRSEKAISIKENPLEDEKRRQANLKEASGADLKPHWSSSLKFLKENYDPKVLDTSFYLKEMDLAIKPGKEKSNVSSPEAVRDHLSDRWKAIIDKKELDWKLAIIEEERQKFVKDLYSRAEELKKLQNALV